MQHALFDVQRPGKPRQYDADIEAQLTALASCTPSERAMKLYAPEAKSFGDVLLHAKGVK